MHPNNTSIGAEKSAKSRPESAERPDFSAVLADFFKDAAVRDLVNGRPSFNAHWFHGMRASSMPIPHVSVIPANNRPAPTNAESQISGG